MYAAGELVVYGGEGVCRVEGVGAPSFRVWTRPDCTTRCRPCTGPAR